MRLVTIGGIAALASAAALAACSDQPSGSDPTGPLAKNALVEGARIRAHGSGSLSLMTARGLRTVQLSPWSAEASLRGGIARLVVPTSPLGVLAVTSAMRTGIGREGGIVRTSFKDASGAAHTVATIYGPDGGPPRAMEIYDGERLSMTAEFRWTAARGGWLVRSVTHRVIRDGAVHAAVTATASTAEQIASRTFAPDALRQLALTTARALGPRELAAQSLTTCFKENLEVIAAAAVVAGILATMEAIPILTPPLEASLVAAIAKLIQAEMAFQACMDAHRIPLLPGGKPVLPPITCPNGMGGPNCDLAFTQ